jgi:TRAP-type mannitol/chloroaromatic compound transport system permease small subunit
MPTTTDAETLWLSVQNQIPGGVLGALLILIVGWVIARLLQAGVTAALRRTGLDRRLAPALSNDPAATTAPGDTAQVIGRIVFWLVMVFVLIAVLDALGLELVTAPLTGLLAGIFEFLPRLFAAILILVLGWLLARIASQIVTSVLAAMGVDRLATRLGFATALGTQRLSGILGTIVYILILLPVITAALDALQLAALTLPLTNMINQILAAIPNIVAAVLLITLAYVVGRVLAELVTSLLTGLGVNAWPARLGLATPAAGAATSVRTAAASGSASPSASAGTVSPTERGTPAGMVGTLVQVAIVWFALIQALQLLGFDQVAVLMTDLLALAGRILLGLIIVLVGLYLARLAAGAIRSSGVDQPNLLATAAQAAILVLTGAMALRQMGVANEIINLAFGLLLGAIAVAVALAFGLGGREVAGRQLQQWVAATESGEAEQRAAQLQAGTASVMPPPSPDQPLRQ